MQVWLYMYSWFYHNYLKESSKSIVLLLWRISLVDMNFGLFYSWMCETPFHCSLVRSHKAGLTFIKNMTEMYSMCEPTRMTNLSYYIVYMYVIWTQFHIVPGPSICAWISVMSSSFSVVVNRSIMWQWPWWSLLTCMYMFQQCFF
jgi:hypothetical protein